MGSIGTRTRQTARQEHAPSQRYDRGYTRDLGLTKNVTASMTFVAASAQIQAAATTFAAFAAGDVILVGGTNANNGEHTVLSTDASTQLTVDWPVVNEGPITATVRTK